MKGENSLVWARLLGLAPLAAWTASAQSPAAADIQSLDAIVVTGQFIDRGSKSAMKQDVDVRDTPFSVANYSASFMKAIETTNIADLYSYMTGIQRGGATGYDLSIRGFKTTQSDKNAIMVDGLPGLVGRFGSPPTFGVDHIEVVKGPASVLYGQAQPGGFVNIITKKPQAIAAALLDLRGFAYRGDKLSLRDAKGGDIAADFTGPLDEAKQFLYRVVLETTDKDTFRDYTWERSQYLAASVTWVPSESTSATASLEYRHRKSAYDNLLVAPNKDAGKIAAITTRYQEPGDLQAERGSSATLALTHAFAGDAKLNFSVRSVRGDDDAAGYDSVAVLADGVTLQRRARRQHNERTYNYFDTNYAVPFDTGFVGHKLLVGLSGGIDTTDFDRIQFYNGATKGVLAKPGVKSLNIDIYNPIYGVAPALASFPSGAVNRRYTRSTSTGVYFSDLLKFSEHWKATLGLRYANEKQYGEERKTPPLRSDTKSGSEVLPMLGLLYQPTHDLTVYTSYSSSFVAAAASAQDAAGQNSFQPQKAKQVEVGVKADLWNGRLSTTVALFDIHKDNTLAPIACNAGVGGLCSQQVGGERSKGLEFEVNARPLKNWQVALGYARTDATVDKSNNAASAPLIGAQLTNAARDNAHLWSRYDSEVIPGLGFGLGVFYSGDHTGNLPSRADPRVLLLPRYTIADLGIYYQLLERYDFTLKIGNLFDKIYYEGVNSTTNELGVVPGTPRNLTLSVRIPL